MHAHINHTLALPINIALVFSPKALHLIHICAQLSMPDKLVTLGL